MFSLVSYTEWKGILLVKLKKKLEHIPIVECTK